MPKTRVNNTHKKRVRKSSTTSASSIPQKHISLQTKLLLCIGIFFLIIPFLFYINEGIQLAFFTPKVIPVVNKYPIPIAISIPSVQIDLPIAETAITRGTWEIAGNAISHLTISARPGEHGAIILYGHNTNDRFGPIRWTSVGEKIIIKTKDNKSHVYTITSTKNVSQNDVAVLLSQKGETLVLYTCDGFADLQRFIVIAKPSQTN